ADTLAADIKRQERQAELDATLEERTPVRSLQEGDPEQEPSPAPERRAAPDRGPAHQRPRTGRDRARDARMAHNTLRMLHGLTTRNHDLIREAQRELARDGWYGEEGTKRAAGDYYSTLVD